MERNQYTRLLQRLLFFGAASGSVIYNYKRFKAMLSYTVNSGKYPEFAPWIEFDQRFFGVGSSSLRSAIHDLISGGFIKVRLYQESNPSTQNQPIHHEYEFTDKAREYVKLIREKLPESMQERIFGIKPGEETKKFVSDMLFWNLAPHEYIIHTDTNFLSGIEIKKDSLGKVEHSYMIENKEQLENTMRNCKAFYACWDHIKEINIRKDDGKFFAELIFNPSKIGERYSYLELNVKSLKSFLEDMCNKSKNTLEGFLDKRFNYYEREPPMRCVAENIIENTVKVFGKINPDYFIINAEKKLEWILHQNKEENNWEPKTISYIEEITKLTNKQPLCYEIDYTGGISNFRIPHDKNEELISKILEFNEKYAYVETPLIHYDHLWQINDGTLIWDNKTKTIAEFSRGHRESIKFKDITHYYPSNNGYVSLKQLPTNKYGIIRKEGELIYSQYIEEIETEKNYGKEVVIDVEKGDIAVIGTFSNALDKAKKKRGDRYYCTREIGETPSIYF